MGSQWIYYKDRRLNELAARDRCPIFAHGPHNREPQEWAQGPAAVNLEGVLDSQCLKIYVDEALKMPPESRSYPC